MPVATRLPPLAERAAGGALAYFGTLWLLGFRLADFNRRESDTAAPGTPPG